MLEIEKSSSQKNLDGIVELVTEQQISAKQKFEEVMIVWVFDCTILLLLCKPVNIFCFWVLRALWNQDDLVIFRETWALLFILIVLVKYIYLCPIFDFRM